MIDKKTKHDALLFNCLCGPTPVHTQQEKSERPPASIESPEIAREWAEAATRFLASVDRRMQAKYLFKDAERYNFHFFPIARRGAPLKNLTDAQRQLAFALMSAGLSPAGNQKAFSIMSLGEILRETDEEPLVYL